MTHPGPRFRAGADVHARWFHDELVVLDLAGGEYFSLDALGGRVWDALTSGLSPGEAVDKLVLEYDVGVERMRADVGELVDELVRRGLLVEISSSTSPV